MIDNSLFTNKKVVYHTLGCKLNFAETSTIARQLTDAGYQKVNFDEPAQVYIINTCSVTENADKECKLHVKRATKANPEVTGFSYVDIFCFGKVTSPFLCFGETNC